MLTTKIHIALGIILFSVVVASGFPTAEEDDLTINVVHTNDMHARFEQTSKYSSVCSEKDRRANKCYGGFARIATLVRRARESSTPSIFLIAGDTYQGTSWYYVHKASIVTRFLNLLEPNATSLGNHEFDDGIKGLEPFVHNATFPILAANIDLTLEPTLKSPNLSNSTIIQIEGKKIGIIGYVTPDTQFLSSTGKVIFRDEIKCIREEAEKLKSKGINMIIALGHSGFDMDKKIAREVADVDLVIGGHTNTFLYNGTQPDEEKVQGFYPTEVVRPNGKKAYVVQAYAYTKYLGNITVTFNKNGDITRILGNPVLVDGKIEQAKDVLEELETFRPAVNKITLRVVGRSHVFLDGDATRCRSRECNLGNLITDALIDHNVKDYAGKGGWTDAAVAIYQGGGIRASIAKEHNGTITWADIISVSPFDNAIYKVSMTGQEILAMLEHSVSALTPDLMSLEGRFLQLSGIQVTYDLNKEPQSKVVSTLIRCADCRIPSFNRLEINKTYEILMPDYLKAGGDGFSMLTNLSNHPVGVTVAEALMEYVEKHSPVYPGVESRINFYNETLSNNNVNCTNSDN